MRYRIIQLLCCLVFMMEKTHAQDAQFSQFYAAPIYLNPAFAGSNSCSRVATNYRRQWTGIPGNFSTFSLSYDHPFLRNNSAVGLLISNDQAGTGKLRSTSASLIYAYLLNVSRKWTVSAGVQATITSRSVNFYDLTFVDQLITGSATTVDIPTQQKVNYFDMSSGLVAFTKDFWAGFSAHHLILPNQALTSEYSRLPRLYSFHSGIKIPVGKKEEKKNTSVTSVTPALNLKFQDNFHQMDLGFYYQYEVFITGVWYRGMPFFSSYNPSYLNQDGLVFMIGLAMSRLHIGYSYDVTMSKLAPSNGGSHEISLSYHFCDPNAKKKRRISRIVPCPKF
jgi:type IX secretion system PorP/SprF family membrane protein